MASDEDIEAKQERLASLFAREDKGRVLARRPMPPSEDRRYPLMRALLQNPDAVPYGLEPHRPAAPPGALFPARKAKEERGSAPILDELLSSMAEGVLIGGSPGRSEMRVSLSDDFFGGTELSIAIERGEVFARFYPPDEETFALLNGRIDELRGWLEARGLLVGAVELVKP